MNYKLTEPGSLLMHYFEGIHDGDLSLIGLQPKMDCSGFWTEGWGYLMLINGKPIKGAENKALAYANMSIHTEEEADIHFLRDVTVFENKVNALNLDINQWQFDALVSFDYNCGHGNLLSSTLLKRIRSKSQPALIEAAFLMWNKSGGKVWDGLIARRKTEAVLFNEKRLVFYKCKNGILAQV